MIYILLLIVIITYIFLNYLVGSRLLKSLNKTRNLNKKAYWAFFTIISSAFFIYQFLNKSLPHLVNKILAFISSYYLSFFLYLLILFPIAFTLTKILKFKNKKIDLYLISLVIVTLIVGVGTYFGVSPYVKKYDIKIDKPLKDGALKVALVSDIHLGELIGNDRLDKLLAEVNSLDADVVLIAGDLIDSSLDPIIEDNMLTKFKNMKSLYGTYFATGNHDFFAGEASQLSALAEENNITVLRDNSILINDDFYIIGRDDISSKSFSNERAPLENIVSNIDKNKLSIVMDHNPENVKDSEENNIDLQVSGHTHGGQVFPGNIITNALFPIDYGYGKFGNTNVVVSSGFGTWGPLIRVGSRSEVVLITLHN